MPAPGKFAFSHKMFLWGTDVHPGMDGSGSSESTFNSQMAYDPVGERLIGFGYDLISSGNYSDVTWQLKDGVFTILNPAVKPSARRDCALFYDHVNAQILLFAGDGPTRLNDLWAFDVLTDEWSLVPWTAGPNATCGMGVAVHLTDDYALFFGGSIVYGGVHYPGVITDTYKLDLHTLAFTQQIVIHPDAPGLVPQNRNHMFMGYDPGTDKIYLGPGQKYAGISPDIYSTFVWQDVLPNPYWDPILDELSPGNFDSDYQFNTSCGMRVDITGGNYLFGRSDASVDDGPDNKFIMYEFTASPPTYTKVEACNEVPQRSWMASGYNVAEEALYLFAGAIVKASSWTGYVTSSERSSASSIAATRRPYHELLIFSLAAPILENQSPAADERVSTAVTGFSFDVVANGGIKAAQTEIYVNDVLAWQSQAARNSFSVTATPVTYGTNYAVSVPSDFFLEQGTYYVRVVAISADSVSDRAVLDTTYVFHTNYGSAKIWLAGYDPSTWLGRGWLYNEALSAASIVVDPMSICGLDPAMFWEDADQVSGVGSHEIIFAGGGDGAKYYHLDPDGLSVYTKDFLVPSYNVTDLAQKGINGLDGVLSIQRHTVAKPDNPLIEWNDPNWESVTTVPHASSILPRKALVLDGVVDEDSLFILTQRQLYHAEGVSWYWDGYPLGVPGSYTLNCLWGLNSDSIWVGGLQSTLGFLGRYEQRALWRVPEVAAGGVYYGISLRIYSVHGFSATDAVAVGSYSGGACALHWNGSTWTKVDLPLSVTAPGDYPYVISGAAGLYYAAGQEGTIWKYDGTSWTVLAELDQYWNSIYVSFVAALVGHPLYNRSYEDPSTVVGEADWWVHNVSDTAEDAALFTRSEEPSTPFDDFEDSWENNHLSEFYFIVTNFVSALFEDNAYQQESFEFSWREPVDTAPVAYNHQSTFTYDSSNFATAGFSGGADLVEDCEEAWGDSPYNQASIFDSASGTFPAATFDAAADTYEDYEEEWGIVPRNEDSEYAFDPTKFTNAVFVGALAYDSLDNAWYEILL